MIPACALAVAVPINTLFNQLKSYCILYDIQPMAVIPLRDSDNVTRREALDIGIPVLDLVKKENGVAEIFDFTGVEDHAQKSCRTALMSQTI